MTLIANSEVKMAGSQFEEFVAIEVFSGDTPLPVTTTEQVAAALLTPGLPALSVVGRDGSGHLIMAVSGSVAPIGITTVAVLPGSPSGTKVPVYRSGCFNPAALNWGASYNTDELKRRAFEGTGAEIVIKTSPVA